MPDRRAEREQNPHIAPQQCVYIFILFSPELTLSLFIIKFKFTWNSRFYMHLLFLDSCSDSMKKSSFIEFISPLKNVF